MTDFLGTPTVHPFLFYTGKLAGYLSNLLLLLGLLGLVRTDLLFTGWSIYMIYAITLIGGLFIFLGLMHLGDAVRVGLPKEETVLHTGGIYAYSRNPIYVGLHLLSIAAILLIATWFVALAVLYSMFVYHKIIQSEEAFLKQRFGEAYTRYFHDTRRYL